MPGSENPKHSWLGGLRNAKLAKQSQWHEQAGLQHEDRQVRSKRRPCKRQAYQEVVLLLQKRGSKADPLPKEIRLELRKTPGVPLLVFFIVLLMARQHDVKNDANGSRGYAQGSRATGI